MSSSEKIKQFNDILDSFLIQISPLVGTSYHFHFQQLVKVNSLLALEQFLVHALPMRDKILNRDESYFTNNDNYKGQFGGNASVLDEIIRLQGIYTKLDDKSKDNVWDIFQALLVLSEEYLVMNKSKYVS